MSPSYRLSTVTTPATDRALTTLDTVKAVLGITDGSQDAVLKLDIVQLSAACENFCNRSFAIEAIQDVFRAQRGYLGSGLDGAVNPLQLARWPIVEILSVTTLVSSSDQPVVLVEGADFEADYDAGRLFRLNARANPCDWPAIRTIVSYRAGYSLPSVGAARNLPPDVERAALRLIAGAHASDGRDPMLREEDVAGIGRAVFWVPGTDTGAFPPEVADLLDNYRVPVVG